MKRETRHRRYLLSPKARDKPAVPGAGFFRQRNLAVPGKASHEMASKRPEGAAIGTAKTGSLKKGPESAVGNPGNAIVFGTD